MRKLLIFFLVLMPLVLPAISLRHLKTDMDNYPFMSSSILPLDNAQEAITELKPEDFKISFGGAGYDSLKVISFEESGAGMSILLCVDVSGSMRGEPLESIKLALLGFIQDKRPIDEIAIAAFAGDWNLISDFSRETAYLQAKIASLSVAPGNTAMHYGAHKSLEQFTKTASNKAQVMILLGDGKDENPVGSYTEAGVIGYSNSLSIPIFTVGYTAVEKQYLQSLEHLADQTGGLYQYANNPIELKNHYEKLRRILMNSSILSYYVVEKAGDGKAYPLLVELSITMGKASFEKELKTPLGKPAYTKAKEKKDNKGLLYVLLGLALVAGAVVILVLTSKKKKRPGPQAIIPPIEPLAPSSPPYREPAPREPQAPTQMPKPIAPERDRTVILTKESTPASGDKISLRMEILVGSDHGKIFKIDASGATIGRAGDNRIVLSDETVSGRHARIILQGSNYVLEEVNARNGVFVNGNRITRHVIDGNITFRFGAVEGSIMIIRES